jgi:serine/threonine protein kinase/Tfp pilus assembly protein PilF
VSRPKFLYSGVRKKSRPAILIFVKRSTLHGQREVWGDIMANETKAEQVKDDSNGMTAAKAIFSLARKMNDPRERALYLGQACGLDGLLRIEVERLLAADKADGAIEIMQGSIAPTVHTEFYERRVAEGPGTRIGPYKLMEQIGEGGFGLVFVAEQHQPVRRRVALKIIKPGMDTRDVIARFEAERQALALMDHPNIAKVFDAGATDSGRPYFVMELVRGIPITEYCDHRHLSPRDRLELFLSLCHAIQHAHQKGIIHRDVKPTNVLVTLHDGQPIVKVIDFGVAKALSQQLTEKTIYTQFAQMIGTPLYMSPEQAEMSGLDIDTRSDIYSLGVLLYELLTGTTPFDRQRMKEAAAVEIRRIICEEDPPRPSTRLSQSGDRLGSIAAERNTDPAKLSKLVRGDLDWIVMKCLDKDRNRRYETANGLAQDVERYLHDEPVAARPPSASYRFSKFARRNKVAMLMISAIAATLLMLLVGLAVSNRLITSERNEKALALEQAEAQRQRAENNFLRARMAVKEILTDAATGTGAWSQLPPSLREKFTTRIVKFYQDLVQEKSTDPSLQFETAVAYRSLATVHNSFKKHQEAEKFLNQSIDILARLNTEYPNTIEYRRQLAWSHYVLGSTLYRLRRPAESEASIQAAILLYKQLIAEVLNAGCIAEIGNCYWELMVERRQEGHPQKGAMDEYIAICRDTLRRNPDKSAASKIYSSLGWALLTSGQSREAVKAYREVVRLDPDNIKVQHDIGDALNSKGLANTAIAAYREAIRVAPEDSHALNNLAWILATCSDIKLRDPKLAVDLAGKAVELVPASANFWNTLGVARYRAADWKAATEALNKSMTLRKEAGSEDWFFLAMAEYQLDNKVAARAWYDKAVERMEKQNSRDPALNRFRAEAGKLLAIAPIDATAKSDQK